MAAKRKRTTGKPPEENKASKNSEKAVEKQRTIRTVEEVEGTQGNEEESVETTKQVDELPYRETENPKRGIDTIPNSEKMMKDGSSFQNKAPLQADERAMELLKNALQHPINLTTEDLLNISEPLRVVLKKLLTKRRVEKKTVSFAGESNKVDEPWRDLSSVSTRPSISELPDATLEIIADDHEGMKKGDLVIGDPISQYLATLQPGEKPKLVVIAKESQGLRAIYPLINKIGEVESLLDSGSQIISMGKSVAKALEIDWDSNFTIEMESANRSVERTLGLAKNVPFTCGGITVYLQVHIMSNPAYKVLLGRPFDIVMESVVKNEKDGNQTLTLTDPNTGERCEMRTYERGRVPEILKRPVTQDFRQALMKQ
jgi:gag-polyprotein putative aspartyl protease